MKQEIISQSLMIVSTKFLDRLETECVLCVSDLLMKAVFRRHLSRSHIMDNILHVGEY